MSVEQVAEQVGYADTTALRRLMRKVTQATPRQFRPMVFDHRRGASEAVEAVYAAATMCRRVAAQNIIADRLTAAPSKQTPCQPAWA